MKDNPIQHSLLAEKNALENCHEDGFVLLTTMMIMVAVALLGLAATSTSVFEIQMAGNERRYQQQFYHADSGINNVLANELKPNIGNVLPALPAPTCVNLPPGALPFSTINPGGGTSTVNIYYVKTISDTPEPFVAEVMSCAIRGTSVAEVRAGIQYGNPPGGLPGSGDGLEYN